MREEKEKNIWNCGTLSCIGNHQRVRTAPVLLDDRYGSQAHRGGDGFPIHPASFAAGVF